MSRSILDIAEQAEKYMEYEAQKVKCQNCRGQFTIEPDDFGFYEKIHVPPPTFCPGCRKQRRLAHRNLFNFYKRKSKLNGDSVISIYSPDSGITVYSPKEWYSDKWDAFHYGRNFDFSKTFFEQYINLLKEVPRPSMDTDDGLLSKNCQYTNDFAMSKNCYLVFKSWKSEDIMYSFYVVNGKDLVDVHLSFGKDEANYETINTEHCYRCRFSEDCRNCSELAFSYDCRNCESCFLCTGLRGKSYCFKNKQLTKDKYKKIIADYKLDTYSGIERAKEEFEKILVKYPRKALRMINCNNCLGDFVYNSRDCKNCFITLSSEHYKWGDYTDGIKDARDVDAGGGSELVYESDITAYCSNVIGSFYTWHCQDSFYLSHTFRSKDCFGCVGLKDAQYCVLNKKYTKEEYLKLIEKIIKHMNEMPYVDKKDIKYYLGDYLPIELSLFGYNESMAIEQFPLTKKETVEKGYKWQDNFQQTTGEETLLLKDISDSINNVNESILKEILTCISCQRNYKITENEFLFYKKHSIPIPRKCFFCRNANRIKRRNPFKLWHRKCMKYGCQNEFETSYAPDRPEIVYCEQCYNKEVY